MHFVHDYPFSACSQTCIPWPLILTFHTWLCRRFCRIPKQKREILDEEEHVHWVDLASFSKNKCWCSHYGPWLEYWHHYPLWSVDCFSMCEATFQQVLDDSGRNNADVTLPVLTELFMYFFRFWDSCHMAISIPI